MIHICRHVEAFEAIAETLSLGSVLYEGEGSGERLISLEAPFKSLKDPVKRHHFICPSSASVLSALEWPSGGRTRRDRSPLASVV
jgi:hypothetical protein